MTSLWYATVLSRVSNGSKILDIGIGNASSLLVHSQTLKSKNITVCGVDYTQEYVDAAQLNIKNKNAEDNVTVVYGSVYDSLVLSSFPIKKFDAAYFSGSISLLPDPVSALHSAAEFVKPSGHIYITQTYQKRGFPGLAQFKRNLKFITTVDFGELTWEKDIMKVFKESGYEIVSHNVIEGSVDNPMQSAYLTVLKVI
ncbi:hypothetical protein TL16_g03630 [Triparma laevis f. inornata]|uniref:Methyltransferase domain-containing protein n=1 Tax=Triparma laevis f. inornata TaxID=1714386 RepID=A0A9W7A5P1_9STRA|nr:hypothetical protein TL16_g03630 [Triparma laevis f. inornata]